MRRFELLKAGVDSQGDNFTLGALEAMVESFDEAYPIPVTRGFSPKAPVVGLVRGLELEGEVVFAEVELNEEGERLASGEGIELAAGGVFNPGWVSGGPFTIESFDFTGAALTDAKVK